MTESPEANCHADLIGSGQRAAVRITTGSRLHFGLLNTAAPFGGVGVMIDQPITEVVLSSSDRFDCNDPAAARIGAIAERVAKVAHLAELPKCRVTVTRRAPQHSGLGSGTQLALAVAEGLCHLLGVEVDPFELASRIAVRGERSAIGVHGYFSGGLLFEAASEDCELNPLQDRIELPSQWCVAIFQPSVGVTDVCGDFERKQFASLSPADDETVTGLRKMITDQLLPAAQQRHFEAFAGVVQRYNRESGKLFAGVQGGSYRGTVVATLVEALIDRGALGVGQSSWGPGVFAWFRSRAEAEDFSRSAAVANIALIGITHPRNRPRELQRIT